MVTISIFSFVASLAEVAEVKLSRGTICVRQDAWWGSRGQYIVDFYNTSGKLIRGD